MPPLTLKVIAKAAMMWNMTGLSDRVLHQMPMGMDEIATANAIDANMDAHTVLTQEAIQSAGQM